MSRQHVFLVVNDIVRDRPAAPASRHSKELLLKLGGARDQSRIAWRLAVIEVAADSATFSYRLDRNKLRQARSREGRYLLRTNLVEEDPAKLWSHYLLLVAVEEAFKNLKGDLAIRPVFHQLEARVEAHVFIAFLAYCLHAGGGPSRQSSDHARGS